MGANKNKNKITLVLINLIPASWRRGHSLTACNAAPLAKSKMAARVP